jgi:ketosteroid isomerase-like protein
VSAEAIALVRQFETKLVEDGEIAYDLIDPDVVIVDHDIPDAGDYRGHDGLAKWLTEDWGSAWESYSLEPEQLVDAGDKVLSIFTVTARGKGSGVEIKRRNATVTTVQNGRVARVEYFTTEEEARAAAGLAASREG